MTHRTVSEGFHMSCVRSYRHLSNGSWWLDDIWRLLYHRWDQCSHRLHPNLMITPLTSSPKGIVQPKIKNLSSNAHLHVVQASMEQKRRYFSESPSYSHCLCNWIKTEAFMIQKWWKRTIKIFFYTHFTFFSLVTLFWSSVLSVSLSIILLSSTVTIIVCDLWPKEDHSTPIKK